MSVHDLPIPDQEKHRQAILQSAFPLFAMHGFNATSIELITSAAGIAQSLFTDVFASKTDILICKLIQSDRSNWDSELCNLYELKGPVEVLYQYGDIVARHYLDTLGLPLCRELILQLHLGASAELKKSYVQLEDRIQRDLIQLLEHFKSRGWVHEDSDVNSLSTILSEVGHNFFVTWLSNDRLDAAMQRVYARDAIQLFFDGVRVSAAESSMNGDREPN